MKESLGIKITCLFTVLFLLFGASLLAQNPEHFLSEANNKIIQGAHEEALQDLNKSLQLNARSVETYYGRGKLLYKLGRYSEAIQDFDKALQLDPEESIYFYMRSICKSAMFNYQDALFDINQAIRITSGEAVYFAERANIYRKLDRYSKALNDCKQALSLSPDHPKALSIRGLIYLEQIEYKNAELNLLQAVRLQSNDSELRINLAEYYEQTGQYDKASEEYTAAINLNANDYRSYYKRALLRLTLKNFAAAQKDASKAIQNNRRFYQANVIRAIASYNLGDSLAFQNDIVNYLKNASTANDYFFLANSAYHYGMDLSIWTKAENWANKAVNLSDNYQNNLILAKILFRLNKTAASKNIAQKAVEIGKKNKEDLIDVHNLIARIEKENIDNVPPVIQLFSPSPSLISMNRGIVVVDTAEKLNISGEAIDESGIAKVEINGNPAKLKEGQFDGETILKNSENLIVLEATDKKGNVSKIKFMVKKEVAKEQINPVVAQNLSGIGTQRALLFATDDYDEWTDLNNPVNDAKTIARELESIYGFKVDLVINPDKDKIMLKIREYLSMKYQSNDQLFIFFAGHGHYDETFKEGYIVAKESKLNDEAKSSYITHSNLRTYINNIPCKHIFMVIDACFSGTFDPLIASRGDFNHLSKDVQEMINRKMLYTTRKYLTSGGKEYVSDGKAGLHSPFCRQLLEALRNGGGHDKVLTLDEIYQYVVKVSPTPKTGEFGTNEPASDFFFIAK